MSRWPRRWIVFAGMSLTLILGSVWLIGAREGSDTEVVLGRLGLVASLRTTAVEVEMEAARSDALVWSSFGDLRVRAQAFERDWRSMGEEAASRLHRLYVLENPHPESDRQLLLDAGDGSSYSARHAEFHAGIDEFLAAHEYYDVFLVLPGGEVAYSYFKEEDFATDLMDGPWRDTGLATAVQAALRLDTGQVSFSEFTPYQPSEGAWSAFFAGPIQFADGQTGALAFQVGTRRIGGRLESIAGTRATANTSLVGPEITIVGEAPWSRPTPEEPESLEQQVMLRVEQGEGLGSELMMDPEGTQWAVAWEATSLGTDRYVTLTQADLGGLKASFVPGRWEVLAVAFLLWLALGTLTLGIRQRFSMARHEF